MLSMLIEKHITMVTALTQKEHQKELQANSSQYGACFPKESLNFYRS